MTTKSFSKRACRLPRNLLAGVVAVLLCVAMICACHHDPDQTSKPEPEKTSQPNILLIVADDLGFSDIGAYGGEISTPHLDRLAQSGLRFTNFHVTPNCSPTRAALLSGIDHHRSGMGSMAEFLTPNQKGRPGYEGYLNFRVVSLAEVLKDAGYHTFMAGKWHLGYSKEQSPYARGFEETFVLLQGAASHWGDNRPLAPGMHAAYRKNGKIVKSLPEDFYSTAYYTDRIIEWIERYQQDKKPFFAYLAYTAPHLPLHAPKEYIEKYRGTFDMGYDVLRDMRLQNLKKIGMVPASAKGCPRPPWVMAWEDLTEEQQKNRARDMEVYAAMVDCMDHHIGRLLTYLRNSDRYDNTVIIFFSDNGASGTVPSIYPRFKESNYLSTFDNSLENRGLPNSFIQTGPGWAQASSTPGKLYKSYVAQGGIRSPCIVKLPVTKQRTGETTQAFAHVIDIMPTLLDLASAKHPGAAQEGAVLPIQGVSMLPVLTGTSQTVRAEMGWELFGLRAFRRNDWKALWLSPPMGIGDWQLYNLADDPAESNDVSSQHPDIVDQLSQGWNHYARENGVILPEREIFYIKPPMIVY